MLTFAIIEVDDGLTIVEVPIGRTAEDVALEHGGMLVDDGPYATFEEATEALELLEVSPEEETY